MRPVAPVWPEEKTLPWINRQGSGFKQAFPNQNPSMLAVQVGDLYGVAPLVAPVLVVNGIKHFVFAADQGPD